MRLATALALLLTACGGSQPADPEAARSALFEADRAWSQTPPDVAAFTAFFAADGSFLPPGAPPAQGHQGIGTLAAYLFATPGFSIEWVAGSADVSASGDLGFTLGGYVQTATDDQGQPTTTRGKYVTVWRKQPDGQWKVVADIFNDNGS